MLARDAFAALTRLARARERTRAGMREKLQARGFPAEEIGAALARAIELGYLDDRRAAGALVQRQIERGSSRALLTLRLEEAGVEAPLVAELLAGVAPDLELAQAAVARWSRTQPPSAGRLARLLASRGFDEELIEALIDGHADG